MARASLTVLCALAALAAAGCGEAAISDNTNKKPTNEVKALLAKGPSPACTRAAPEQTRVVFIEAHPELTNAQLAAVCPQLYPRNYARKHRKDK